MVFRVHKLRGIGSPLRSPNNGYDITTLQSYLVSSITVHSYYPNLIILTELRSTFIDSLYLKTFKCQTAFEPQLDTSPNSQI